jgi:protein SCO1/2
MKRRGETRATRRAAATVLAVLAALALAGCGGSSDPPRTGTIQGNGLQGLILKPAEPAPPLDLPNFTGGKPVSLTSFHGKAVLVTFVYTHCPNVCPLITSDLAAAKRDLGRRASELQILEVTVDPRRDTPAAVRTFLTERGALGRMDYLLGPHAALWRTWKAWKVGISVDTKTDLIGHTSIIYGIDAAGRMAVVYPSTVTPAQIVHDVPLLARA